MTTYSEDTRRRLLNGMDSLARAVATTLGPKPGSVVLHKKSGETTIAYDGMTVAKEFEPGDPHEKRGAQLLAEAALKTYSSAGDGTATTIVLAHAMVTAGWKRQADRADLAHLTQGIIKATQVVVRTLDSMRTLIRTKDELASVAATAVSDFDIGRLVADAMEMVGKDGLCTVMVSRSSELRVECVEGFKVDGGYVSPHFISDSTTMESVIRDPHILICGGRISVAHEIAPVLGELLQARKQGLLVIADDVVGEALATVLDYKTRGLLNVVAVQAAGSGTARKAILEDIAVVTGGTLIREELGAELPRIDISLLGRAKEAIVTKDHTTIVEGGGKSEAIRRQIEEIKDEIERAGADPDARKIAQQRLANLCGGIATIRVGSAEKKLHVEKALSAARTAVEAGIVPGGGIALFNTIPALNDLETESKDEALGVTMVREALQAPLRTIVRNAGQDVEAVKAAIAGTSRPRRGLLAALFGTRQSKHLGYDVLTGQTVDVVRVGIIDPAQVVRSALENAASAAITILGQLHT